MYHGLHVIKFLAKSQRKATLIKDRKNLVPNYSNLRAYRKKDKSKCVHKSMNDSIQVYLNICHLIIKDSIQELLFFTARKKWAAIQIIRLKNTLKSLLPLLLPPIKQI